MSDPTDPLEQILRFCAAAAPEPWYPRLYADKHRLDRQGLDVLLEELWLEGLIERTGGSPETGPGVGLTERGRRVLEEPELLERLRAGQPLEPGNRGAVVRAALRSAVTPWLTRLLLVSNVAVFAWGWHLASLRGVGHNYLSGPMFVPRARIHPATLVVLHQCGMAERADVVAGQWWRLLTANWVHLGLPHLLLNMLGLYVLGRQAETMWGRWRFLAMYLVSAWAGVCIALMYQPPGGGVAGASGAVCGLLGAEVIWLLANRKCLPATLRRRASGALVTNVILLVVISLVPGVSGAGHLGGALAGATVAVLLQIERFGPMVLRLPAAAAALILVPAVAYALLDREIAPERRKFEDEQFERQYLGRTKRLTTEAQEFYQEKVRDVLDRHPARRDAAAAEALLPDLDRWAKELADLATALQANGPRHDPATEEARQVANEYATALAGLYEETAHCLHEGIKWTPKDEKELRERQRRVVEAQKAWNVVVD
jgi:membrane associated rhomboid family serine protease